MVAFISLGPGDPELLTVKALRMLREADMVLVPATKSVSSVGNDGTQTEKFTSRAADIINYWHVTTPVKWFPLPMMRDSRQAMTVYDEMCAQLCYLHQENKRVAVAVEGDISVYASIHYVQDKLASMGIPVEQVPGITSFIAAAAVAKLSLVSHQERMMVVPGNVAEEEMEKWLHQHVTLVIMKLTKCETAVKSFMKDYTQYSYYYFENVGSETETCIADPQQILNRRFPYFSLMIIKP